MKLLFLGIGVVYVGLGISYFKTWLKFFLNDQTLSRQWMVISWVILAIASTLWILVVPFAYLELLNKVQRAKEKDLHSPITPDPDISNSVLSEIPVMK